MWVSFVPLWLPSYRLCVYNHTGIWRIINCMNLQLLSLAGWKWKMRVGAKCMVNLPKFLWQKQHEIWFKCLHQDQIYCQWLGPTVIKPWFLQFSSKLFVLPFLKGTHLNMLRNEIFDRWAIAKYLFWLSPYIQDPTKFISTFNVKKGKTKS